jgi:hypothetical protein
VESASAVSGEDALDGLAALVERSLLQVVPGSSPTRYRMLETIREYGLEKLGEADELETMRTAHASYFADLVARAEPRLRREDQQRWFKLLRDERENVIAGLRHLGETGDARRALKLAVDLLWFWLLSSSQEEAKTWLEFAAAVPGEVDPDDRTIADSLQAFDRLGHTDDAEAFRRTMHEVRERAAAIDDHDRPLVAVGKVVLGIFTGDEEIARAAEEVGLQHPDPWVHACIHMVRAGTAENEGDVEMMGPELAAAREGFTAVGDAWGTAMALFIDSGRMMVAGDLEQAEAAMNEAREALMRLSPETAGGMLDVRFADLRVRRGDFAGAREYVERARARHDLAGDDFAYVQSIEARISWLVGEAETAQRQVEEALERLARRGPMLPQQGHGEALLQGLAATLAAEAGNLEEADRRLAIAHRAALGTTDMPVVASIAVSAATIARCRGDEESVPELLSAAAALRGSDDPTNPEIARLNMARGPALTREAALARLEAEVSRAAPVSP